MRRARLGCFTSTALIAMLVTVFFIVGTAIASGGKMFSPGDLNAVAGELLGGVTSHADIGGACSTCHVAPWDSQIMGDRCLVCHEDVPTQMLDLLTPHGRMFAIDSAAKCQDCHPEHRGSTALLTEIEGWKYPHDLSGYSLKAHQFKAENDPFKCVDCHGSDVTQFDVNTCETCHSQIDQTFTAKHVAEYGTSCLDCHDGKDSLTTDFSHDVFQFKLTGKHGEVSCENCHRGTTHLVDFRSLPQDCFSCHGGNDPHKGALGTDCQSCHTPDGWKPSLFDHNKAAFKLDVGHANVTCEKCHLNKLFKDTPTDCFSCHKADDPHEGVLGTDCQSCHKPTTWKDTLFNHSRAAFGLVGKHVDVACADCHKDLLFKGTATACASCHVDVHIGQMGMDCAKCHNPSDWKDVNFDHGSTGFKLIGSHASAACSSCHTNGIYKGTPSNCFACHAAKDAHNGQFGTDCGSCHVPTTWKDVQFDHSKTGFSMTGSHKTVPCTACHVNGVFKGTPKECVACHASDDAHNGQFGTVCSKCHNTNSWKDVNFDHGSTGFPLAGSHKSVACKSCHTNNVYKGTPSNCYSCHAAKDKHNGQFGTDCGSCHKPTKWSDVSFDHNKTSFSLTGKHTSVQCVSCHTNGVYKGTPTNCYSCHAAKDKHNGQFGTNCGSCHVTSGWANVNFDHGNTAFPLTGKHTGVQCTSCHVKGVYKGTPTNCYSCHAAKDKHNGQFGTNCGSCHVTSGWANVNFNHGNTAFPLTGSHKNVQCASCHVNGVYKGTPTNCYSCHAGKDQHNGQFGTNCGSCHNTSSWANVTFDHGATGIPLIGKHSGLSCGNCHQNGVYAGTPSQCVACHQDNHNGEKGTDCAQCHTPKGWGN